MSSIIMSIHPKYADLILEGKKTIELRSRNIKVLQNKQGRTVYLYATSPVKKIVGECTMLNEIWDETKPEQSYIEDFERVFTNSCISKEEFVSEYMKSYRYSIYEPVRFKKPVDIKDFSIEVFGCADPILNIELIANLHPGIKRPPQSYQYIDYEEQCRTCEHCRRGWCMLYDHPILSDGCSNWSDNPLIVSETGWEAGGQ